MSSSEVAGGANWKSLQHRYCRSYCPDLAGGVESKRVYLAVQGCEHLNRALVVERELADKRS